MSLVPVGEGTRVYLNFSVSLEDGSEAAPGDRPVFLPGPEEVELLAGDVDAHDGTLRGGFRGLGGRDCGQETERQPQRRR